MLQTTQFIEKHEKIEYMKTLSHKQISILLALLASMFTAASLLVNIHLIEERKILYSVFVSLVCFTVVYIISYYSFRNFILQKIKPIYKTIHSTQAQTISKANKQIMDDLNLVKNADKAVAKWAKEKAEEIDELKKLEKYRKEYIGNVSHELKTPIFSIQGYILTLLDGGLEDKNINIKYLERADKAINRMISIIRDLEAISGLESGELSLQYEKFDILLLFKEIFEAQEWQATERNIKLSFKHEYDKPILVNADRKRIGQLIMNLIVNSIKYGKEGGATKVSFYDMDEHILIQVKDNGIGISKDDLKRIFERFYRADKSRSREQGGTGLGLSIVKHIIEAHHQTINVKSELGKETSFTFTLEKAQ